MSKNTKNTSVVLDQLEFVSRDGENQSVSSCNVRISGIPGIGEIRKLMNEIDEITKNLKEDYVAITDLRGLKIAKFLQMIILYGMEKTYKSILSVSNPAKLSFVIIPHEQKESKLLQKSLEEINENESDEDYKYEYIFTSSPEEAKDMVARVWN